MPRLGLPLRLPLLASTLLVSGCANLLGPGTASAPASAPSVQAAAPELPAETAAPPAPVPAGPRIGVLLPLSGPNGSLGAGMLRAAQLAVKAPGSPVLDARDTAGPAGAGEAARMAIQSGDRMILGPLTSGDTAAVAPVAQTASVPVLAFTSDVAQARPGVWVMGVTPEQQVRRLVLAAKAQGHTKFAALLPANGLGEALAAGLTGACADAGLPPPTILTHAGTPDSIAATMKQLADTASRQAAVDQQVAAAAGATPATAVVAPGTPTAIDPAPALPPAASPVSSPVAASVTAGASSPVGAALSPAVAAPRPPLPAPPFDALLLGDTGLQLHEVILALGASGVSAPQVQIMGPELWGAFASKLRALAGAWYAGPDPASRSGFASEYRAAYGQSPKPLSDFTYDAAALTRSLATTGYAPDALTRADGFAGVDGVFTLKADGHVHRALAIFQIHPGGGSTMVQPAPRSLDDTAS